MLGHITAVSILLTLGLLESEPRILGVHLIITDCVILNMVTVKGISVKVLFSIIF